MLGPEGHDVEAMAKQEGDSEPVGGSIEELDEAEADVAAIRIARPGSTQCGRCRSTQDEPSAVQMLV